MTGGIENFETTSKNELNFYNYQRVSIIGGQGSSKSSLLNSLFDTNFPVLDAAEDGLQKTTYGMHISNNKQGNMLVFDCEGWRNENTRTHTSVKV